MKIFPAHILIGVFILLACNEGHNDSEIISQGNEPATHVASADTLGSTFQFLSLDSATIRKYYDMPQFRKFVFVHLTEDLSTNFKKNLLCYALDHQNESIGDPFSLQFSKDSTAKPLSGRATFGNLELSKTWIQSTLRNGNSFKPFQYLLFAPTKSEAPHNNVWYKIYIRPKNTLNEFPDGHLNPSPPARPSV